MKENLTVKDPNKNSLMPPFKDEDVTTYSGRTNSDHRRGVVKI